MISAVPITQMLDQIFQAATVLKQGGLVAFPTETVYGLGADASNPSAVAKIFAAKGRPADHPLIVHLVDKAQLTQWAQDISPLAQHLAAQFWPGPLTLILKKAPQVSDSVTGGQDTIGLRVPGHPIAQALLQAFGGGIAAPSANRFGHVSPTQAEHVRAELKGAVDFVLDGGACPVGIESTIVDVSGEKPRILRPGTITASQISEVVGYPIDIIASSVLANAPRVSGMLESHYAPTTPLKIMTLENLLATIQTKLADQKNIAVLARTELPIKNNYIIYFKMPMSAENYAQQLYATMREADAKHCDVILVEALPEQEAWIAIRDRLQKAAAK